MRSLRTKFTLIISFLIILVLGGNTFFVLTQKTNEISEDIFRGALSYAQLVSTDVLDTYQEFEGSGAFLLIPQKVKNLLDLNFDISNVRLVSFEGEVIYDFNEEQEQRYSGPARQLEGAELDQVRINIPSVMSQLGEVAFIDQSEDGAIAFIDASGQPLPQFNTSVFLKHLVFPVTKDESFALMYDIRYDTLQQRVWDTSQTALIVAGGSLVIAFIIAFLFASGIVRPLRKLTRNTVDISRGKFGQTVQVKSKDEVGHLARSFNKMSVELKSALDQLVSKERLSKEIELASKIQSELLPKDIPVIGGLDIAAGVTSAEAVGGDLYDFIQISDDHLLFYIGDVTGHGVTAGLVTAIANSIIFSHSENPKNIDMRELSLALNRVMHAKTRPDMFITAFIGLWDAKKKTIEYTPCGHEPTYIYNQKSGKLDFLKKEGIALGMLPMVDKILKGNSVKVQKDDVYILYSDGIPEARGKGNELYGFDRFEESIKKHATKDTAKEIYDGILDDVYRFMDGGEQADDVTLIVMKKN